MPRVTLSTLRTSTPLSPPASVPELWVTSIWNASEAG
jgi:hypothetical protein